MAEELANLLAVLADNRYFFGRRLSEWIIRAPGLEQGVACAALAGEEMGFARVLYGLLERIPAPAKPATLAVGGERQRRFCLSFLDRPFPSWALVVATLNLVDPALNLLTQVLTRSTYEPLAQRCSRILDEESFHDKYARGRLLDAAGFPGEARRVQASIDELWPETLMWFGRDRATRWPALLKTGLLPVDEDLTGTFERTARERLHAAGFRVPDPQPPLQWGGWDLATRRLGSQDIAEAGR